MGVDVEPLVADERSEALVRAPGRPLLGYALGRVDRPEDAADVVADTMLVAWRRLDEVPAGGDARPWLFGLARRALANSRRGLPRRDRLGERLRTELGQQVAADRAAAVETDLAVRVALAGLDADDREVLLLTTWEGLQPSEIAVALDLPAPIVRTRLHRARQPLRQWLTEPGVGGDESDDDRAEAGEHSALGDMWTMTSGGCSSRRPRTNDGRRGARPSGGCDGPDR
jgi:RNA polymerase sigma-70 factor, ECF subfamily